MDSHLNPPQNPWHPTIVASVPFEPPPDLPSLLADREFARRLARGLVHDEHLAEDVVQDAMLAALRRPPAGAAATRAWLSTVTRNFAYQSTRAKIRRLARERRAAREEAVAAPEDAAVSESDRREIGAAVLALRDPYRSAILLRFFEDLAPSAIAERLGTPVETVKTRLKRGLAILRARLGGRMRFLGS